MAVVERIRISSIVMSFLVERGECCLRSPCPSPWLYGLFFVSNLALVIKRLFNDNQRVSVTKKQTGRRTKRALLETCVDDIAKVRDKASAMEIALACPSLGGKVILVVRN